MTIVGMTTMPIVLMDEVARSKGIFVALLLKTNKEPGNTAR